MTKPPDWPFRCPREGWYLSKVEAIFRDEVSTKECDCDCDIPVLVHGICKQHGRVYLSNHTAYEASIWKEKREQVQSGYNKDFQ